MKISRSMIVMVISVFMLSLGILPLAFAGETTAPASQPTTTAALSKPATTSTPTPTPQAPSTGTQPSNALQPGPTLTSASQPVVATTAGAVSQSTTSSVTTSSGTTTPPTNTALQSAPPPQLPAPFDRPAGIVDINGPDGRIRIDWITTPDGRRIIRVIDANRNLIAEAQYRPDGGTLERIIIFPPFLGGRNFGPTIIIGFDENGRAEWPTLGPREAPWEVPRLPEDDEWNRPPDSSLITERPPTATFPQRPQPRPTRQE